MSHVQEILIVDDERIMREGFKANLEGEGYAVRTARDGEEALRAVEAKRPDLVLLDVMMPNMNGFRCCEEIRRRDALLPIVFLTAKDSEADQVRGLGLGGDDYVSKTASDALVLASVRRALERTRKIAERDAEAETIRLGSVTVDLKSFAVLDGGREIARLTKTEADILSVLDAHRGEMLVADDLITELRGNGFACEDSMLYSHMSRLRRKLGRAAGLVATTRGVGYGLLR